MTGWFAELLGSTAKLSMSFPKPVAFQEGLCTLAGSTSNADTKQPPCKSVIRVSCGCKIPSVSDYPAHVILPALCLVSPAGPLQWHGQPLPNPAYILLVQRGTSK